MPESAWMFVDESWPLGQVKSVGVLGAVVMTEEALDRYDRFLYSQTRKYLGEAVAKHPHKEMKGQDLLSRPTLRRARARVHRAECHVWLARELLAWCKREHEDNQIFSLASTVYESKPSLLCQDPKRLDVYFKSLCVNASAACQTHWGAREVKLVFDQRLQAQQTLSVGVRRYVDALNLPNVFRFPLLGVSHAVPGLQLADLVVYVIGQKSVEQAHKDYADWYSRVRAFQWQAEGKGAPHRYGFNIFKRTGRRYRWQSKWERYRR